MKYELPKLMYKYDALEPYIDSKTMEIHYTKHHQAYIDNLNKALEKHPEIADVPLEELLGKINTVPEDIRLIIRNHGGGHINHSLFWELLKKDVNAEGKIINVIKKQFGSLDKFKELFTAAAMGRFGSGWAWLVVNKGILEIISTPNQDSPLIEGKNPVLALDVWEHAFYLRYLNKKADYISSWWNVVNWKKVNELYEAVLKK